MELIGILAITIGLIVVLWKYVLGPWGRHMARRQLERAAEAQIYADIAWQNAQAAAAEKILRKKGEKP